MISVCLVSLQETRKQIYGANNFLICNFRNWLFVSPIVFCVVLGYTKAARCKSLKSIAEKFNWKQVQVKMLNQYLQTVRRGFKFVCEVTVTEYGLVSKGGVGHNWTHVMEKMDREEKLAKITKRHEDIGGVYKMIQLAVNEERSSITKKMMAQVQGESQ